MASSKRSSSSASSGASMLEIVRCLGRTRCTPVHVSTPGRGFSVGFEPGSLPRCS
jgi:hypothetical protein